MNQIEIAENAAVEVVKDTTNDFLVWAKSFLTWENLFRVIGAFVAILVIWIVYKLCARAIKRVRSERLNEHKTKLLLKFLKYIFFVITCLYVLNLFNINVKGIWGAAGVVGIAIAFAAQTSVSNVISGIFVIIEKSIRIGDFIEVNNQTGIVDTIGLLSIRIHTLDNQMIRIPNSDIINSNFVNINYFPERRMNLSVSVSYDTDLEKALAVLRKVPARCKTVLKTPEPLAWIDSFGDSGINLVLAVWFSNTDFIDTKNAIYVETKKLFDAEKISIPFNRLDVSLIAEKKTRSKSRAK